MAEFDPPRVEGPEDVEKPEDEEVGYDAVEIGEVDVDSVGDEEDCDAAGVEEVEVAESVFGGTADDASGCVGVGGTLSGVVLSVRGAFEAADGSAAFAGVAPVASSEGEATPRGR